MKITYIAGPMRGYPNQNIEAFYSAEQALKMLGWLCLNPARMDAEAHPNVKPEDLPKLPIYQYVERDLGALVDIAMAAHRDKSVRGAVHFLPGWHLSVGAKAEHAVAEWLGLERIYL